MRLIYLLVATSALNAAAGLLDWDVPQRLPTEKEPLTVHSAAGLAHPYIARSNFKEAYAILHRALNHAAKAPKEDRHTFYAQIGNAAFQIGKFMDSATYYAEAFSADRTEIAMLGKLINALAAETTSEKSSDSMGLLREATSYVQQALEALPPDPQLNLLMGKIHMIMATKWLQRTQKELKRGTSLEQQTNLAKLQMHNVLRGITHF